ncbi:LOW QUALITY PROTEIN: cold shock domain-containing protein E1-like [Uloborus diversus]|uniref:LOW QUALITY PROTEIN: cold shock domain-containing protein E1-like n=1 Tax=Uloborus diversus TaxID=327109 RepID=UPI002409CBDC|nr:LOW QUALITY PROTEIN: cold shock domain-containing protein E1-like [Uloborus diversus]
MASPQWKNFQPSAQDSATPNCQRSPSFTKTSNDDCLHDSNSSSPSGVAPRETGIVEKLLHSYGFIQCCERQARLFFHYSQYSGNIEHLKLGDAVEFEMTYDRRTGKPIASAVCKITSEVGEVLCEERVSGFITTEIKDNTEGRVAYESRGECFFLPYSMEDIDGTFELHPHDKVTFQIATDKNTGNLRACTIRLEKPLPTRFQGVICALKETFGFIERADVVKEIFFHSSECKNFRNLALGDDVEFSVQTRNNKEVAVNVVTLPLGTVVFEDVNSEVIVGEITEALEKGRSRSNDAFPGKIQCQINEEVVYYPFGERDPKAEYTLQVGDWVQFNVATDRRDNLQRATNIELLINALTFSKEKREQGFVTAVKETFGFITYGQRDIRLYFRLSELLNPDESVKPNDEVEFTVSQDPASPGRSHAIRIRMLPPGTITYSPAAVNGSNKLDDDVLDDFSFIGVVEREPSSRWNMDSPHKDKKSSQENSGNNSDEGIISFNRNGVKEKAFYSIQDCELRSTPRTGDKVEFIINQKEEKVYASHIKVLTKIRNGFRYSHRGFIAALKDTFGFIETEEHEKEVFFHYSVFDGNASSLEVGQEVEYGLTHKGSKLSAECVRKLSSGTIPKEDVLPEVLNGVVLNPVRCFNPDQEFYPGKIRMAPHAENMDENLTEYEFGITSLSDKHEFLQKGDVVQFQIGITRKGKERAMNIKAIRARIQATVDTIKGNFGFLSYEAEEGKKLFFHMSEVKNEAIIQPGDKVEFVVVHHQKTGKYSACSVVKIGESQPLQRPERLNRLRTMSTEGGGPKLITIRPPKGPDGTNGFKFTRISNITEAEETSLEKTTQDLSIKDVAGGNCLIGSMNNELNVNNMESKSIVCSQG